VKHLTGKKAWKWMQMDLDSKLWGQFEGQTLAVIKISIFRRAAETNLMVQMLYSIS
jgi:hypothetical protein